jgi:phosphonate transport system substrate-binding protein
MTISPDFNTKYLSGWFVLNTILQKALGEAIHLQLFDDFESCREAIMAGKIDLIYANPYDASLLLRDKGFVPVAHPQARPDEALIAVNAQSAATRLEDFKPGVRIATTGDPEVNMICMIMLESADLAAADMQFKHRENYVLVAKDLIKNEVDAGFILAETFNDLSPMIRDQLRIILKSQIHVIHHMLLVGPGFADKAEAIQRFLCALSGDEKGRGVLRDIGINAWVATTQEEAEFMVDLMDTLMV